MPNSLLAIPLYGMTAFVLSMHSAQAADGNRPAPVPVNAVQAEVRDLPKVIAGIGTVAPLRSVTVRPRVGGQILDIAFREGQDVAEGDVLMRIDPRDLEAALQAAEARKQQDSAQLSTAMGDAERYGVLAQKDIVSAQTLDQKTAAVKQLQAMLAADDAAITTARNQLAFATVTAPIGGRTGFKTVDLGTLVAAGTTDLVTITQMDPIAVVFVAPGDRFDEIRSALTSGIAEVEAWSTDGSRLLAKGHLTLMDNAVDPANGSIRLRATFDNGAGRLWPGLPVATRLTVARRHGVTVPDKALTRGPSSLFAYVIQDNGTVRRQPVSVAFVTSGDAAIRDGLSAGDRVVTDGTSRITDGTAVTATMRPSSSSEAVAETAP